MNLISRALSVARSLVGVREVPAGSNSGKEVSAFLKSAGIDSPAPWCASFVYYCIEKAADELNIANPFVAMKGKAWTPSWLAWADKHEETLTGKRAKSLADSGRLLFDTTLPTDDSDDNPVLTPGMFFLLYYPKLKRVGHIGLIASPLDAYLLLKNGGKNLAICDRNYAVKYDRLNESSKKDCKEHDSLTADCLRAIKNLQDRGLVATIEGNTDPAGSRTGGCVSLRTRKLTGLHRIAKYG